jgi:hypothetical protein
MATFVGSGSGGGGGGGGAQLTVEAGAAAEGTYRGGGSGSFSTASATAIATADPAQRGEGDFNVNDLGGGVGGVNGRGQTKSPLPKRAGSVLKSGDLRSLQQQEALLRETFAKTQQVRERKKCGAVTFGCCCEILLFETIPYFFNDILNRCCKPSYPPPAPSLTYTH